MRKILCNSNCGIIDKIIPTPIEIYEHKIDEKTYKSEWYRALLPLLISFSVSPHKFIVGPELSTSSSVDSSTHIALFSSASSCSVSLR